MSKGMAVCKNCGEKVEGDFLELCKKVMAGLACLKCGSQIGSVKNLDAISNKKENENEKNTCD